MAATVVLDQQVRNGTFTTSSLVVPPTASQVTLGTTMSTADASDTAKQARVGMRFSWDDGLTFDGSNPAWSYIWQGGVGKNGEATGPSIGLSPVPTDANGNPANRIMAFIDTLGFSLNTGVTLDAE